MKRNNDNYAANKQKKNKNKNRYFNKQVKSL